MDDFNNDPTFKYNLEEIIFNKLIHHVRCIFDASDIPVILISNQSKISFKIKENS